MYRNYIKRLLDLLIGLGVLGLLWPVMGLMALAIYIEDRVPSSSASAVWVCGARNSPCSNSAP